MATEVRKATTPLALTAAVGTTATLQPLRLGRIINNSGGGIVITWYESEDGDSDNAVVCRYNGVDLTTSISDGYSDVIPESLSASAYLHPVLSSGTATVHVVHME